MLLWYTEKGKGSDYHPLHHCFTFSCEVETPFPTTRRLGKVAGLRGYWTDEPPGSDVSALTTSPTHTGGEPRTAPSRTSSSNVWAADICLPLRMSAAPHPRLTRCNLSARGRHAVVGEMVWWRERETFHACAGLFLFYFRVTPYIYLDVPLLLLGVVCWALCSGDITVSTIEFSPPL